MLSHSQRLDRALSTGTPVRITPLLDWSADRVTWYPLEIESGSHTQDRTNQVRWTLAANIKPTVPIGFDGIHPYGCRLRLRLAVSLLRSSSEIIPAGMYSVTGATENSTGGWSLQASSFEQDVIDSTFPVVRNLPDDRTMTYRRQAEKLITEAVPDARFSWDDRLAYNAGMPQMSVDSDRWSAIQGQSDATSIAAALGADAYCDSSGGFSFAPRPSLSAAPVWEFSESAQTKINASFAFDRQNVANLIVVTGTPADGSSIIGPIFAWDSDPQSPTYAGPDPLNHPEQAGLFGVKPYRYDSPLITTSNQGWKVGQAILADMVGESKTVSFTGRFHPCQEAGDVVRVTRRNGRTERHLVDSITYTWMTGAASYTTRSTKEDVIVVV